MPAPRVFLSYARADTAWTKNFCHPDWFRANLAENIAFTDYQDVANFGSIKKWIEQEVGGSAGLVAFISRNYTTSEYSQAEWDLALELHAGGRLIVVPVIMDQDAKSWWDKRKLGVGDPDEYAYSNFADPRTGSHPVPIIGEGGPIDAVTRRIGDVARLLSSKISTLESSPNSEPPSRSSVILLGHPTSKRQASLSQDVDELATQLRAAGISHRTWKDQWADPDQPAGDEKELLQSSAVFVQPAAPTDAAVWSSMPDTLTSWLGEVASKTGGDKTAKEVAKCRTVLWMPARHRSDTFERRAKARADTDNPMLRHDTPTSLATWVKQEIGGEQGPLPVVAIEEFDAGDLREALQSGCEKVVFDVVRPPTEPWPFYNEESLEDQLRLIEGERAIIAVHDLNTGHFNNKKQAQTAVESKIKKHKQRANEIAKSLDRKLDLFWTVLLVENVKLLSFIRYPGDKLADVTFLPFRKTTADARVPVAPDPQGARIYQSYLKDWVAAPN